MTDTNPEDKVEVINTELPMIIADDTDDGLNVEDTTEDAAVAKQEITTTDVQLEHLQSMVKMADALLASSMFRSATGMSSTGDYLYVALLAQALEVPLQMILPYIVKIKDKPGLSRQGCDIVLKYKGIEAVFLEDYVPLYSYIDDANEIWNTAEDRTPPIGFNTNSYKRITQIKRDNLGFPIPIDEHGVEFRRGVLMNLEYFKGFSSDAMAVKLARDIESGQYNYVSDDGTVKLWKGVKEVINGTEVVTKMEKSKVNYARVPVVDTFIETVAGTNIAPFNVYTVNRRMTVVFRYKGRDFGPVSITLKEAKESGYRVCNQKYDNANNCWVYSINKPWFTDPALMMYYKLVGIARTKYLGGLLFGMDFVQEDVQDLNHEQK